MFISTKLSKTEVASNPNVTRCCMFIIIIIIIKTNKWNANFLSERLTCG